ncbi:MAG: hypothetical protein CFE23_15985 [Flavobacterium sp. BFFFF1]|uniref:hypothetical protein n=1 Tax=Flavobacterium sp. BFFFF1 TaxID=2015557 RepID=UPI000BD1488D|nr:hypothetical protein [Flavobacterium sp. BFFFF1]OYU79010.1 MAG: hypothetical protein CFE23_15985 [Flavobacterium sp. BFFFF1]
MVIKFYLILLFLPLNCLSQTTENSTQKKDEFTPWNEFSISLIKLIATPEKYDGKRVQVIGYLNLEFEGEAIYLHEEDFKKSLSHNAVHVNFSKTTFNDKNLSDFNQKYVIIAGTFRINSRGNLEGEIENITRLDLWKFDK